MADYSREEWIEFLTPKSSPDEPGPPTPKKRGAQPGNRNALRHGFYSRTFHPTARRDLDHHHFKDLQDEITMLRVYIRRVLELSGSPADLPEALDLLRAVSLATVGITRLVRASRKVSPADDDLTQAFNNLVRSVREDPNLHAEQPMVPGFIPINPDEFS